jgi:hypothetical protein
MRRLAKPSLTWAVVVLVLVGVIGITVAFAVHSWPSGTLDARTVLAKSRDAEAKLLAEATEGKVFHQVDRVYRRHGPAAAQIRAMSDEWYLPESYWHELWVEVGGGGKIGRVYGSLRDDQGGILLEIRTVGGEAVTRDVATGAEERWLLELRVEDIADYVGAGVRGIEQQIADGSAIIVGYGDIGGRKTIILEVSRRPEIQVPQAESGGQGYSIGYSIPYTVDLNGVERVRRTEVDSETFFSPSRWSVVVIDADGKEHLVEERTTVTFEILDRTDVPRGVFSDR